MKEYFFQLNIIESLNEHFWLSKLEDLFGWYSRLCKAKKKQFLKTHHAREDEGQRRFKRKTCQTVDILIKEDEFH